ILAPVGSMQVFDPEAAAASGKAAGEFGTIQVVSSASLPSVEEAKVAGDGPKVYQLYVRNDLDWVKEMCERIKAAGYIGFCLTVDTALQSRRERAMLSGFMLQGQRLHRPPAGFPAYITWDMMAKIKEMAGLPFLIKGIATAEDAKIAVDYGVDVI